jgi:hypothetical protein
MEFKEPKVILVRLLGNSLHIIRVGVLNIDDFLRSVFQPARKEHLAKCGDLLFRGGRRYQGERVALPDLGVTLDFEPGRQVCILQP